MLAQSSPPQRAVFASDASPLISPYSLRVFVFPDVIQVRSETQAFVFPNPWANFVLRHIKKTLPASLLITHVSFWEAAQVHFLLQMFPSRSSHSSDDGVKNNNCEGCNQAASCASELTVSWFLWSKKNRPSCSALALFILGYRLCRIHITETHNFIHYPSYSFTSCICL